MLMIVLASTLAVSTPFVLLKDVVNMSEGCFIPRKQLSVQGMSKKNGRWKIISHALK